MPASNLEETISQHVNDLLRGKRDLKLLEAGCGSSSYFSFANVSRTVGIDISQRQLDNNQVLQEKILGDLQIYPLQPGSFDIVVCWDVIEHLSRPRAALLNMFQSLQPGGLLVLGFPNLMSFKGMVTKFTPHWFHELFYRYMKYQFRPFPTFLRLAVLPNNVVKFARENGLQVSFFRLHEGGVTRRFRERFLLFRWLFAFTDAVVRVVSVGNCNSLYLDNCALVLRRLPSPKAGTGTVN